MVTIKSGYIELKKSLETCQLVDQQTDSVNSSNDLNNQMNNDNQMTTNRQQDEDLRNLDILIKQLTDRWNNAMHLFKNRLIKKFSIIFYFLHSSNICFSVCFFF